MLVGAARAGYTVVGWGWMLWDFNWFRARSAESSFRRIAGRVSDGDIIVMHDGHHVNPRADRGWAALVIAGTLCFLVLCFGGLTGAGFNPARAFGPALVSGEWGGFDDFVITYVLAPIVGAVIAALAYFRMVIVPGKKGPEGMEPVG